MRSDLQDRLTAKLQGLKEAKARKQAKTDAKSFANSFTATSQEAENLGGHKAKKAVTTGLEEQARLLAGEHLPCCLFARQTDSMQALVFANIQVVRVACSYCCGWPSQSLVVSFIASL